MKCVRDRVERSIHRQKLEVHIPVMTTAVLAQDSSMHPVII